MAGIGQRLAGLGRPLIEELFLANYGDALTDAPLPELVADFERQGKVAAFLSVRPRYSFHMVSRDPEGIVTDISDVHGTELWRSDGTDASTTLAADINPGSGSSYPSDLAAVGATIYFAADDGTVGQQPWTLSITAE